ncbi:MAG: methyltransferase domain-containing protein [Ginsengibacter sp.]
MAKDVFKFSGQAAENYDKYLGPILFEPFAKHTSALLDQGKYYSILELACGTGRLTNHLATRLSDSAKIIATDISRDMIQIAKTKIKKENVKFEQVDAHNLPYDDESFDLVICQFGVMFFKDFPAVLKEVKRVMKTGAKFVFSTWDKTENSPLFKVVFNEVLLRHFDSEEEIERYLKPFSMFNVNMIRSFLETQNFTNIKLNAVMLSAGNWAALDVVNAFFLKHSILDDVMQKDPDAIPFIVAEIQEKIGAQLKSNISLFNLSAIICTAQK